MTTPGTAAGPVAGWGVAASRAWELWRHWCAATGRSALPGTVDDLALFTRQVPGSAATIRYRISTVARGHGAAGYPLAVRHHEPDHPWRTGAQWLTVPAALANCPVDGWPAGFHGRRDAWLVVLCGELGLYRREVQQVTAADVTVDDGGGLCVAGQAVPVGGSWQSCPACAVTRWLRVVGEDDLWGRNSVKAIVHRLPHGHDCAVPVNGLPWEHAPVLTPGIDRWGWTVEGGAAMSLRQISAVLAVRQSPTGPVAAPVADTAPVVEDDGALAGLDMDELLDLLDQRTRAADAALKAARSAPVT